MLPDEPLPPLGWLARGPWPDADEEELPDLAVCAGCPWWM